MTTHRPTPDKDTIALLPPFERAGPGPDYAGEYRRSGTRNFHNRLGKNTNVYLASAELAAITSKMGKFPTVARCHEAMGVVNADGAAIYQCLNFNQIEGYVENAKGVAA